MSKARTLADFISDGSEFADGTISVAEVSGAAPLASPTFTGNIDAGDNVALRLGDSDDLQLYHDGSASYIDDQGEGPLKIKATDFRIKNAADTKNYLRADDGGAVSIYYDNALKLSTAADGVDITGDVGATTATITGKTTTDELDLNAIAATISDTAVDIFVYDTRKDSDGGAWRKRTQHTSWYNETLNTATRGSRKEFPAVAVIVAESNQVTIYDGDDPDLPMWMVFNEGGSQDNSNMLNSAVAVSALNATLVISGFALTISFLKDSARAYRDSSGALYWNGPYDGNIAERNSLKGWTKVGAPLLVNGVVNDVAMTVLPNAPIDAATGLPVPTIAVATDGGISIIKDDGTVIDGPTSGFDALSFNKHFNLAAVDFGGADDVILFLYPTWLTDGFILDKQYYANTIPSTNFQFDNTVTDTSDARFVATDAGLYEIGDYGLAGSTNVYSNPQDMIRYTTSSYNTGWMNGDIKLATLSDTDDTDVTGSELVSGGDGSSATNWLATGSGSPTMTAVSGQLFLETSLNGDRMTYPVATVSGKTYVFDFESTSQVDDYGVVIGTTQGGEEIYAESDVAVGHHTYYFVAQGSTTYVGFKETNGTQTTDVYFDYVSVRLAEEDRSVNGNGLQVFGSITKNFVATGADLVAYSGFSGSNYLEQPYNSDLDFGTGDFCVMGWVKGSSSGNEYILSRTKKGDGSNPRFGVRGSTDNSIAFNINGSLYADTGVYVGDQWQQFIFVRKNGTVYSYINGEQKSSEAASSTLTLSDSRFFIGNWGTSIPSNSLAFGGSLALLRISATAPSPEQIKKIYEDEKVLFQENAQATLYGSSDAVTALAYDDSTELLHVGTSAGRSVFQGLRRVDNTTTAVGAAISASNGLVADE